MKRNKYDFIYCFIIVSVVLVSAVISSFSRYIIKYSEDFTTTVKTDDRLPVIILDAGHGGEDSGAVGADGTLEKDLNLKMCFQIKEILESLGYKTVMTRTEDRLMYSEQENIKGQRKHYDLKNRYLTAIGYDDCIFVSIHMNKFNVEKYKGLQVYYSENNILSKNLAYTIQNNTSKNLQTDNVRQIKPSAGKIYLLDRLNCPAVMVECGFLSNIEDTRDLSDPVYRKKLSLIIAVSLIENIC